MSQLPVSTLIRQGTFLESVSDKRKSKDEYRRQKDLEEQRKAGTAPAMVDIETGRDINPHIPEFIEKTPWYVPSAGPTLKHQRPHPDREKTFATISDWYPKGPSDRVAFKYREGACENCGAMGHKRKDCFERPRTVGAKFTNSDIAPDDQELPNLNLNYDAKRDRWSGYDPTEFNDQVVFEYKKMNEARKMIRAEKITEADGVLEDGVDEDIYAEDMALGQSVDMDSRTRITVRNLRIREDTAKYLHNLNENSAYYDPKSRAMHENPFENMPGKEKEAAKFTGENFIRYSGEVAEANEAQVFAWQARCKGIDIHSLAEPTRLEALKKEYESQIHESKTNIRKELLDKYGGEEHLQSDAKDLLLAQTETYVEYNRKGKITKGSEKLLAKSRYEEDAFINNHTSVFGSYWKLGRWGYKCCHSFVRNSYCLGDKKLDVDDADQKLSTTSKEPIQGDYRKEKSPETAHVLLESKNEGASGSSSDQASEVDVESSDSEEETEEMKVRKQEQLETELEKKNRDEKKRKNRREKRKRHKERKRKNAEEGQRNKKKAKLEDSSESEPDSSELSE